MKLSSSDEPSVSYIASAEGLMSAEARPPVESLSETLRRILDVQVRSPSKAKLVSCRGMEICVSAQESLRVNRTPLGKQIRIIHILWREGVTEIRVAYTAVVIRIITSYKEKHVLSVSKETQLLEPASYLTAGYPAFPLYV